MNVNQRRLRRGVAVTCLVGVIAAPAASAEPGQFVGPYDPSPPGSGSVGSPVGQRTPTELGQAAGEPGERRSAPDQRQSSDRGTSGGGYAAGTVIRDGSAAVPFVPWVNGAPPAKAEARFDWGDAAIGASAMLALIAIAAGAALAAGHRPRRSVA
jgi:hypothetical protein